MGEYVTRHTLYKRGWTDRMKDKLLGTADRYAKGKSNLYKRDRVEQIEATAAFAEFDRSLPPVEYATKAKLQRMGWTRKQIAALGKADIETVNPHFVEAPSMKMFDMERVMARTMRLS